MLTPLHDNVIVDPVEVAKKTASGILLSGEAAKPKQDVGVVIAVGPGKLIDGGQRAKMSVAVGDRVIYGGYSQNTITHDERELVILSETDILAVVEVSK